MSGVSAQASWVTNGRSRCRSLSVAPSLSCIAKRQIGREKHSGMSSTLLTGWYGKPAAMIAASVVQVPPSGPGNGGEPTFSVQFRIWSKPSMVAVLSASRPRDGDVPSWTCQTQDTTDTTVAVRSYIGLRAALALFDQRQNGSNDVFEFGDPAQDRR